MAEGSAQRQRSARQLALLVDAVIDYAIFPLDIDGTIVGWNAGAERIKGYKREEIVGEHFSRFYTREDIDRDHPAEELKLAIRDGRYEEEGWRVRKDGSRFWASVTITALRESDGELTGFAKVTRDLTARKLGEDQMRLSIADLARANRELLQFRLLVASVRDYAIFALDPGGHVVTWNEGARHIKGYEETEVVGRHFSIFYTAEDRDRKHPAHELEVAAREGRYEEEGWRVRKDGARFWANVIITPLRGDSGVLTGYAKVTRDLTERRVAELALRDTAAELERFATAAAHELSEPLHTMTGLADLALDRYGPTLEGDGREFLTHISASAHRLQRRVDGLLEYARGAQAELAWRPVALADAVGHVIEGLGARIEERGAVVEVELPDGCTVQSDADMLEVVLQNLVANALKFTEADPRITISAEERRDMWCVWVADNGIGIAPEQQEGVFAIFQRLHSEDQFAGTGMGLALALRIVERHGGSMGVESEPGAGSRFWFTLPAI